MLGLVQQAFNLFNYDVEGYFREPVRPQVIERVAAQVPGVTRAKCWLYINATYVEPDDHLGMSFPLFGAPADQQTAQPTLVDGRWLLPEDGQAIVALQAGDYRGDVVYAVTVALDDVGDALLRWGMAALVEIQAE